MIDTDDYFGGLTKEEAGMLYHTFLNWKDKADMYDDLCR